jgi:hypothetical protein
MPPSLRYSAGSIESACHAFCFQILRGRLLAIKWARGMRKTGVSKNTVASYDGRAFWGEDAAVRLKATLYRGGKNKRFDSKEIKISLEEMVKAGKMVVSLSALLETPIFRDGACAAPDLIFAASGKRQAGLGAVRK